MAEKARFKKRHARVETCVSYAQNVSRKKQHEHKLVLVQNS